MFEFFQTAVLRGCRGVDENGEHGMCQDIAFVRNIDALDVVAAEVGSLLCQPALHFVKSSVRFLDFVVS